MKDLYLAAWSHENASSGSKTWELYVGPLHVHLHRCESFWRYPARVGFSSGTMGLTFLFPGRRYVISFKWGDKS